MTLFRWLLAGFFMAIAFVACSSVTEPVPIAFQGTLMPVGMSTIGGSAAAIAQFDRTQVSISIRQAEPEITYSWGIHVGTCTSRGELQGGAAVYTPLTPGEDGMASADGVLSVLFGRGVDYSAWVERQDADETIVVACGDLEEV